MQRGQPCPGKSSGDTRGNGSHDRSCLARLLGASGSAGSLARGVPRSKLRSKSSSAGSSGPRRSSWVVLDIPGAVRLD